MHARHCTTSQVCKFEVRGQAFLWHMVSHLSTTCGYMYMYAAKALHSCEAGRQQ
jgi:tRNA U38,U39,U40 pseudouridine synthase TruA